VTGVLTVLAAGNSGNRLVSERDEAGAGHALLSCLALTVIVELPGCARVSGVDSRVIVMCRKLT
jgi:hypothetical protein